MLAYCSGTEYEEDCKYPLEEKFERFENRIAMPSLGVDYRVTTPQNSIINNVGSCLNSAFSHMSIDVACGCYIGMTKQILTVFYIYIPFKEQCCKSMSLWYNKDKR